MSKSLGNFFTVREILKHYRAEEIRYFILASHPVDMDDIIAMIRTLVDKGHAYQGENGDVYYSVTTFDSYGQLSGKKTEDLQAGARVAVDESKKDPLDFVLWKSVKPDEPSWVSPWGNGRPGWHIECSAMSTGCLGPLHHRS